MPTGVMRIELEQAAVQTHAAFQNCQDSTGMGHSIESCLTDVAQSWVPEEQSHRKYNPRRSRKHARHELEKLDRQAKLQQPGFGQSHFDGVAAMRAVPQEKLRYEPGNAMTFAIQVELEKLRHPTDGLMTAAGNTLSHMPAPGCGRAENLSSKRADVSSLSKTSTASSLPDVSSLSQVLQAHGMPTHMGGATCKNGEDTAGKGGDLQNPQADCPSLVTIMRCLREFDRNRVIIVRKINQLGFESEEILKAHYASYGEVKQVYLSRCVVRARTEWLQRKTGGASSAKEWRQRASTLGFVVMGSATEVQGILANGKLQKVYYPKVHHDVTIHAEPFQWNEDADANGVDDLAPKASCSDDSYTMDAPHSSNATIQHVSDEDMPHSSPATIQRESDGDDAQHFNKDCA